MNSPTSTEVGQGRNWNDDPLSLNACDAYNRLQYYLVGINRTNNRPNPLETSLDGDFHLEGRHIYSQG